MPASYKPVEVLVASGGRLLSNVSADRVGIENYSTKRDWRREIERERCREGHDYFQGNQDVELGDQPFPNPDPADLNPGGDWGGTRDEIPVRVGWFYRYLPGANEDHFEKEEDGSPITAQVDFQATEDTVFVYPKGSAIGDARTYQLLEFEPITLIHEARRPNGQKAVIVGTPTTLYRFFSLEDPAYYEGTGSNAYFEEPPALNAPYYEVETGAWIVIGTGFDPDAQRWEAVSINGWSCFNNGVDLMVSYRIEDRHVTPIYELRESGVASVGTIAEFFGILMLADIREIHEQNLVELFDPVGVQRSGAMTAQQSANTVTTPADFFVANHQDQAIVFDDGSTKRILGVTDARTITVDGDPETVPPQRFRIRTRSSQVGSIFSGSITGTQANGSPNVTASASIFLAGMDDGFHELRYINGWSSLIVTVTDTTHVILADNAPEAFTGLPFYIVSSPAGASDDYRVTAAQDVFTSDMVGRLIWWEDGTTRRIRGFIDATHVFVDSDIAVPIGIFSIENPDTYAKYDLAQHINRISYQVNWSMNDLPTRFAPVLRGSIEAGSWTLKLANPAKSVAIGDQLLVSGAGEGGGNMIAKVLYVAANQIVSLDTAAVTTVRDGLVEKNDALNSIVGFAEIQDDTSGIIRMLELGGQLVIYKDTAICLARYTGDVDQPFVFGGPGRLKRIPSSHALFYRNTLMMVNNAFHLYAGRGSFYRLDLVTLFPQVMPELEVCKDIFFKRARLGDSKWLFAADNILTHEIFFGGLSNALDGVLCLDYQQMTASSSALRISAAGAVKQPSVAAQAAEQTDWFIMGTGFGVVLIYGLVIPDRGATLWNGRDRIFYRRDAFPFSATQNDYDSVLASGLSAFGSAHTEKDIRAWIPMLAGGSPSEPLDFELLGTRNIEEEPQVLAAETVEPPETLVSLFSRDFHLGDRITVFGIDRRVELVGRIFEISGVRSQSAGRRVPT